MTLHIAQLKAENYKRLVAVEINPGGKVVTISGRNAQGKSSVLDAIWAALAGGEASRATSQPIRDGENVAFVRLDLGEYIVTRRWTKDDAGTLIVETPPNDRGRTQKFSSPQRLLDEMLGKRAFDPLAFTRLTDKEQVAALVATVDLPFDPEELDAERRGLFDQRTEIGREVKRLEGQLASLAEPTEDAPETEVSAADVLREIEQAQKLNNAIEELGRRAEHESRRAVAEAEEVARLSAALEAARERLTRAEQLRDGIAEEHASLTPVDVSTLTDRLVAIDAINAQVRAAAEHRRVAEHLSEAKARQGAFTAALQQIDAKKAKALADVEFPVPGLAFDEAGVTLNGIPLRQASSAEQLRVSAALAMTANPELRILQIRDGSLLDSQSMGVLAELAEAHDYQVWVEVVDESGQVGIVIEDGQVSA